MEAKLIIIKGKANKAEVALKLPCTIGRSREADLTIAHPMVSRQHCQVFEVDGLLKIRDLGSLNGTFLGDQQIQEAELYPNTEFSIGPLTFRAVYEYAGPAGAEPRFTPAGEPSAAGAADVPDFLPADEPPPAQPPLFGPRLSPTPEPDAGAVDASVWEAAMSDGEPAEPPIVRAAAPAPASPEEVAEQHAADALAEEDDESAEKDDESAEANSAEKAGGPSGKRGWWPFGGKSKAKKPSPEADNSSEDESTLPADAEAPAEPPRLPEAPEGAASTESPDDVDLDEFFKGLP
jgi:hypothetical protein